MPPSEAHGQADAQAQADVAARAAAPALPRSGRRSVAPRLLIVPGLGDSGPAHWQSWLQSLHRGAARVQQADWHTPDLDRWAATVGAALAGYGAHRPAVVAAHSFGCLAVARHLQQHPDAPVLGALLVAPADPERFGLAEPLASTLAPLTTLVASDTDPWMSAAAARRWAATWGSHHVNLGDAGHINAEAGFGPLPLAARWVQAMLRRHARGQRPRHALASEWSFAR